MNQRHSETWWWNSEVGEVITKKRRLYKIYKKSKKEPDKMKMNENKSRYHQATCMAKREVSKAQEIERKKFDEMLDEEDRKRTVFRVAKQIVKKNADVVGGGCVKDIGGKTGRRRKTNEGMERIL